MRNAYGWWRRVTGVWMGDRGSSTDVNLSVSSPCHDLRCLREELRTHASLGIPQEKLSEVMQGRQRLMQTRNLINT